MSSVSPHNKDILLKKLDEFEHRKQYLIYFGAVYFGLSIHRDRELFRAGQVFGECQQTNGLTFNELCMRRRRRWRTGSLGIHKNYAPETLNGRARVVASAVLRVCASIFKKVFYTVLV